MSLGGQKLKINYFYKLSVIKELDGETFKISHSHRNMKHLQVKGDAQNFPKEKFNAS